MLLDLIRKENLFVLVDKIFFTRTDAQLILEKQTDEITKYNMSYLILLIFSN